MVPATGTEAGAAVTFASLGRDMVQKLSKMVHWQVLSLKRSYFNFGKWNIWLGVQLDIPELYVQYFNQARLHDMDVGQKPLPSR